MQLYVISNNVDYSLICMQLTFPKRWLSTDIAISLKQVTEDAKFEEDLKLQRGDVVVLVLAVLKKYSLSLSYVEARKMSTIAELIDYIESQVCQDESSSNDDHEWFRTRSLYKLLKSQKIAHQWINEVVTTCHPGSRSVAPIFSSTSLRILPDRRVCRTMYIPTRALRRE